MSSRRLWAEISYMIGSPFQNIYQGILMDPSQAGGRHLRVFSGYASSAFAYHVLNDPNLGEITVELIIGMASTGAVPIWDHLEFQSLSADGRFQCAYLLGPVPSHSKLYVWLDSKKTILSAFTGSCNFSWSGFRDLVETAAEADKEAVANLFPSDSQQLIDCNAADVQQRITFSYEKPGSVASVDVSLLNPMVAGPFVDLPLVMKNGEPHNRAGLNWGQRSGRDPNQAYIPIPKSVHTTNEHFFPPRQEEFTVITDDGHSFLCVVAQDSDKALETKRDNAELGRYFRTRLALKSGEFVTRDALKAYGRQSVRIFRLDHGTYYMDFCN
jgi:hypothetical protein